MQRRGYRSRTRDRRIGPHTVAGRLAELVYQAAQRGEAGAHGRCAFVMRPDALRRALDGACRIADGQMPQHARGADDAVRRLDDVGVFTDADGLLEIAEVLFDRVREQIDDEAPLLQVVAEQFGEGGDHLRGESGGDVGRRGGCGLHGGVEAIRAYALCPPSLHAAIGIIRFSRHRKQIGRTVGSRRARLC